MKLRFTLIFLCSLVLTGALALSWVGLGVFSGDDLRLLVRQEAGIESSSILQCLTEHPFDKWRPLTSLCFYVTRLLGDLPLWHVYLNLVLHSLNVAWLGCLMYRVQKSDLFSVLGSLAYATSSFTLYHVSQRFGLMESLCVANVLFMLHLVLSEDEPSHVGYARILALNFLFLTIGLFHERFLVLMPFCLVLTAWLSRDRTRCTRLLLVSISPAIIAGNVLVKQFTLGMNPLVGTGGQNLTLSIPSVLGKMWTTLLLVFGFNHEPLYLACYNSGPYSFAVACLLIISVVLAMAVVVYAEVGGVRARVLALCCAVTGLLISCSVTFRIEFRWGAAVWIMSTVLLCYLVARARGPLRIFNQAILLVFLVVAFQANYRARANVSNLYLFGWAREAESLEQFCRTYSNDCKTGGSILLLGEVDKNLVNYLARKYRVHFLDPKEAVDGMQSYVVLSNSSGRWAVVPFHLDVKAMEMASGGEFPASEFLTNPGLYDIVHNTSPGWYRSLQIGELFKRNAQPRAESYLLKAVKEANGGNPYPAFSLGQFYHSKGDLKHALEYYSLAYESDNPSARNPGFKGAIDEVRRLIEQR